MYDYDVPGDIELSGDIDLPLWGISKAYSAIRKMTKINSLGNVHPTLY